MRSLLDTISVTISSSKDSVLTLSSSRCLAEIIALNLDDSALSNDTASNPSAQWQSASISSTEQAVSNSIRNGSKYLTISSLPPPPPSTFAADRAF